MSDIVLENISVDEHVDGAVIGEVSVTDSDGEVVRITIAGDDADKVEFDYSSYVPGGSLQLKLKNGVSLDHETDETLSLHILAQVGSQQVDKHFIISADDVNEAPTDITIDNVSVDEAADGALVGNLGASDEDDPEFFTFALTADPANDKFEIINDNELRVKAGVELDFEAQETHNVEVQVTDKGGLTYTKTIAISVNDVDEAPTGITLTNKNFDENADGAIVGDINVAGGTGAAVLSLSGVDKDKFEIVSNQLKLKDGVVLDYENDAQSLNVKVVATDGGNILEQDFVISVNDVNEAPFNITVGGATTKNVLEEQVGVTIGKLAVQDQDGGDTHTFTLVTNPDGMFEIEGGNLKLRDGVKFDREDSSQQAQYTVKVQAEDAEGLTNQRDIVINVTDVNENPNPTPTPNQKPYINNVNASETYAEGDDYVNIFNENISIFDNDGSIIYGAEIKAVNGMTSGINDRLELDDAILDKINSDFNSNIVVAETDGRTLITLSGAGSLDAYEQALAAIEFSIDTSDRSAVVSDRTYSLRVNDYQDWSATYTTTVAVEQNAGPVQNPQSDPEVDLIRDADGNYYFEDATSGDKRYVVFDENGVAYEFEGYTQDSNMPVDWTYEQYYRHFDLYYSPKGSTADTSDLVFTKSGEDSLAVTNPNLGIKAGDDANHRAILTKVEVSNITETVIRNEDGEYVYIDDDGEQRHIVSEEGNPDSAYVFNGYDSATGIAKFNWDYEQYYEHFDKYYTPKPDTASDIDEDDSRYTAEGAVRIISELVAIHGADYDTTDLLLGGAQFRDIAEAHVTDYIGRALYVEGKGYIRSDGTFSSVGEPLDLDLANQVQAGSAPDWVYEQLRFYNDDGSVNLAESAKHIYLEFVTNSDRPDLTLWAGGGYLASDGQGGYVVTTSAPLDLDLAEQVINGTAPQEVYEKLAFFGHDGTNMTFNYEVISQTYARDFLSDSLLDNDPAKGAFEAGNKPDLDYLGEKDAEDGFTVEVQADDWQFDEYGYIQSNFLDANGNLYDGWVDWANAFQAEADAMGVSIGFLHYIRHGAEKGRSAQLFSEQRYLEENPGVEAAVEAGTFSSGYDHYVQYGYAEMLANAPGRSVEGVLIDAPQLPNLDIILADVNTGFESIQDFDPIMDFVLNPDNVAHIRNYTGKGGDENYDNTAYDEGRFEDLFFFNDDGSVNIDRATENYFTFVVVPEIM